MPEERAKYFANVRFMRTHDCERRIDRDQTDRCQPFGALYRLLPGQTVLAA